MRSNLLTCEQVESVLQIGQLKLYPWLRCRHAYVETVLYSTRCGEAVIKV
jgi:hypothetical protein